MSVHEVALDPSSGNVKFTRVLHSGPPTDTDYTSATIHRVRSGRPRSVLETLHEVSFRGSTHGRVLSVKGTLLLGTVTAVIAVHVRGGS